MLDKLIGGIAEFGQGYGHKNYRSGGGYGFEEHKEFVTHVESEGGYFDRQARYDRMRLPANHGRPPMVHMPVCDEEDSDVEEYFESSRSHHTTKLPHHQQPPHLNYRPPPPVTQPHHNGKMGKMGNGWQGQREDTYHGGHGMQHHGGQAMQHHGGHGIQHHGEHGVHHYDMHGMQHQGGHGMQHYGGGKGMKHQDGLMAPHVPPRHGYMNPNHGSGAVVVKATENWQVSNSRGRQIGWGSKQL